MQSSFVFCLLFFQFLWAVQNFKQKYVDLERWSFNFISLLRTKWWKTKFKIQKNNITSNRNKVFRSILNLMRINQHQSFRKKVDFRLNNLKYQARVCISWNDLCWFIGRMFSMEFGSNHFCWKISLGSETNSLLGKRYPKKKQTLSTIF